MSYLASFRRYISYDKLKAKHVTNFSTSLSLSFGALLWMLPLEVRIETCHKETTVIGLSCCEDHTIVAWVIFIQCRRVTDGRMKRRVATAQAPQNSLPPKVPYPQIVAFHVQDMLMHCENIFLLLKVEICRNLCVHLPLSMQFHIPLGSRFEINCHTH